MKPATIAILTIGVVYASFANAQTADTSVGKPTPEETIKTEIDSTFARIDSDKNGNISRSEFGAYMEEAIAAQLKNFNQTFDTLDINKDGKISREEAAENKAFAAGFDEIDTDKNGFISKQELAMAMKAAQDKQPD